MKVKIDLGDKVRCKYTGFIGIAVARTEFINGCIQYTLAPKWNKKENLLVGEAEVDQGSLEVVKPINPVKPKEEKEERRTGGPNRKGVNLRGF